MCHMDGCADGNIPFTHQWAEGRRQGKMWEDVLRPCCCCLVSKLCPTPCNTMRCGPPGSPDHGICQAGILEWVVISFSRGSSWPRQRTCVSCIGRWILYHWATRETWGVCRTGEKRRLKAALFWEIPGPGILGLPHLSVPQWALPSGSKTVMPSCFLGYDLTAGLSLVSLVAQCKEPACQCRRCRFDPWVGRSPGERNGNPLQYSCLEKAMDRGAWWAIVYGVAKSWTRLSA